MAVPTTPLLGRSKTAPRVTPRTASAGIAKSNANGNILNFFQKAGPIDGKAKSEHVIKAEESLFLDDDDFGTAPGFGQAIQTPTPPREYEGNKEAADEDSGNVDERQAFRYNEDAGPVKKRKTETTPKRSSEDVDGRKKPFFSRSESPDDMTVDQVGKIDAVRDISHDDPPTTLEQKPTSVDRKIIEKEFDQHPIPSLKQESTSYAEANDFEGIEDFIDDEFPEEGEEYLERRWMQAQAELEMGLEEDHADLTLDGKTIEQEAELDDIIVTHNEEAASCPICDASLSGLTDQVRSRHLYLHCKPDSFTGGYCTCERMPRWQTCTTTESATACQTWTGAA